MRGNTISMHLTKEYTSQAKELYQYDYGQRLILEGVELPSAYEVHFSNESNGSSKTVIGDSTGVDIPDEFLTTGKDIHVWIYLHDTDSDGETEYHGVICVTKRAKPTTQTPTPVQQNVITQAIAALNAGVTEVEGIAEAIPQTVNTALAEAKASGEFDGEDGFSPIATVEKTGTVATITITDKDGTTTAEVRDGLGAEIIDDTAGYGVTDKVWSANKTWQLQDDLTVKADQDIVAWNYGQLDFPVAKGTYCIHNGDFYKAFQNIQTYEAWNGEHWEQVTVGDEFSAISGILNGKYEKPSGGIPSSDLSSSVQSAISKADSAYQKPSGGIPGTDLADDYIKEPSSDGTNGQVLTTDGNGGRTWTTVQGGGGTTNYNNLTNKPSLNYVTLEGNTTLSAAGIASASDCASKYTKPSGGIPSSDMANSVQLSLGKADTGYAHATESGKVSSAISSGLYKIAVTAQGHIASATAVSSSDITSLLSVATTTETQAIINEYEVSA